MLLRARELLNLSVFTESGAPVGRLVGFEFEAESQTVLRYEVRRSLFGPPLLVGRNQVISIDRQRMVVEDAAVREMERKTLAVEQSVAKPNAPVQACSDSE